MIQSKKIISISICILLILCPLTVYGDNDPWNPIVVDGYFDDWQDKPSSLEMKDNNQNTPNDSLHRNTISLFRDNENVYLYVQIADLYGQGIPGSGRGFEFWCDGNKVTFRVSPADEIYLTEELPEEILPEELPEVIQQEEQLPEDSQQKNEAFDESRLMAGPPEEEELLYQANNKKSLSLNELPEGRYPLLVEYEAGKYEADGAEAYLVCNEDRIGDRIEIKIPYTAFSDADKHIDSDNIKTIEFQNPHLTHRKIICTGTDTAPYLGIALAVVGFAGGYFLWKRRKV